MKILTTYDAINPTEWGRLLSESPVANWFQTPAAYTFIASQPELFTPFLIAVEETRLQCLCMGYVTREHNPLKQFFTRRAIIIGGPLIAPTATNEHVFTMMQEVRDRLKHKAIYIETRNFNDYANFREGFAAASFIYQPHLNFHVDTSSAELIEQNLDENRRRNLRASFRNGATVISQPTHEQLVDFYRILQKLYTTRVKTPLFPLSFFEQLYNHPDGSFLLVSLNDRIIGGIAAVQFSDQCIYEWFVAGEDGLYKHVYPSSVATYAGLKYAAENHIPRFDMMGAGTPDTDYGVRDFKARFGGQQVEHGRYLFVAHPILYRLGKLAVKMLKHR
ncbi:MAG: GNAT family N-acetyltransferase [Paludibacteraceae bacterium]|nr:GNAT family N-acetyltransferase [Paludibacteraceae bacterium]